MTDPFDPVPEHCIICGEAHSTCAPADAEQDPVIFPPPIQPEHDPNASVLVPHDVFREVPGHYPRDTMTVLRYAKGTRITPDQARECGLLPIESQPGPALETK